MHAPANQQLAEQAARYLQILCAEIGPRPVGSAGNRAATDFFAATIAASGFAVEQPSFDCFDWQSNGATLTVGGQLFAVLVSPYASGCQVYGPLRVAAQLDELAALELEDAILLLRGDLAKEQLMPKNFPFYNPESHRQIISLLEAKAPQAIICATSRDAMTAGALYPFPLFEDGDFAIPSVYTTDQEGDRLAELAGAEVELRIDAWRSPARGCNVLARKGADQRRRLVCCAHIDAKSGTPGALDDGAGIVTLLLLAALLADYQGRLTIELVAINGEDYYSSPGEQLYLAHNQGRFDELVLGVNLDGLGYRRGACAYSFYDCLPELADPIRQLFAAYPELVEGEAWYQGDHVLFLLNQRPALAITSTEVQELMTTVVHTAHDTPELVDPAQLAAVACALRDLALFAANEADRRWYNAGRDRQPVES